MPSHKTKAMEKTALCYLILVFCCLISLTRTAPSSDPDISDSSFDGSNNQVVDYNTVMTHFKDFFMYLPVMFTTFKETMSGFPKLAESIKILTSPYEKPYHGINDDNCQCKTTAPQNGNEIDKSANRYG